MIILCKIKFAENHYKLINLELKLSRYILLFEVIY